MYSRKKRVHPVLLLILAVVFLLMAGAAATRTAEAASSQGYTTDWYRVHVQVMKNYEFRFTEKIRVNFSERRHGIYRDIPTGANYRIRDIRVDGDAYSVKRQDGSMVVRIGSADRYVTGKKTYTIHYTLAHITRKGAANDIYTDLLPTGWSTGIGSAGITMDLPADLTGYDLVICGHNYESHFSPIKYIEPEELVYFVTVEGTRYAYSVVQRETVWPLEIDKMLGKEDVPWDLTLFTCNNGGESRCTVRCMRVDAK